MNEWYRVNEHFTYFTVDGIAFNTFYSHYGNYVSRCIRTKHFSCVNFLLIRFRRNFKKIRVRIKDIQIAISIWKWKKAKYSVLKYGIDKIRVNSRLIVSVRLQDSSCAFTTDKAARDPSLSFFILYLTVLPSWSRTAFTTFLG